MLIKFVRAVQFLTILPIRLKSIRAYDGYMGKSSACFPLVGLMQGSLLALVYAVFGRIFTYDIVAALQVLVLVLSNGGFHLDGLSDTFDALASRKSREKMIAVMKDSAAGPIGVVSIVLVILLKYILFRNVDSLPASTAYVALILTPTLARWSMVPALFHAKSARSDGLGKIFIEQTGARELFIATCFVTGITAAIILLLSGLIMFFKMIILFIVVYILSFLVSRFFEKKFGGLTGDNLGAITEMSEVIFLLMFLAG